MSAKTSPQKSGALQERRNGAVAHTVERVICIHKVAGSIPASSITLLWPSW